MEAIGTIGRYELLSRIGAGGMGEVYLARAHGAQGFEKQVVIKRILPHLAGDAEFTRRFIAEGKLVVQLRHAGIAQVLDMGEDDGATYIAMEHIDGRDLSELLHIARAGDVPVPIPLVCAIAIALLEALDYAHRAVDVDGRPMGIIHRDVSPANVMISRAGEVKLVDFGIARATERLHQSTSGAIRGKYNYMSPQQAAGKSLDARSDQFSVGVMLWELLAAERPFDGPSDLQTLDRIRFHDPGAITALVPDCPPEVAGAVERMLQKDPEARFPTAHDAVQALQSYLIRLGDLPGRRDISAWVEQVLETLPAALRDQPGAIGRSLDDVLRLGLGPGRASTPGGTPAPRTATIHGVPDPSPGPGALQVAGTPAVMTPAHPGPVTVPGEPPKRSRSFVTLIVLNLLLLSVVGWFVARSLEPDEAPAVIAEVPVATAADAEAGAVEPADVVVATPAPPPDVRADQRDGALAQAPDAAPDAMAPADPPNAGQVAGALLGERLAVSTQYLSEQAAKQVRPRATPAVPGDRPPRPSATDAQEDLGTVRFRYLPYRATVFIDGKPLPRGESNVVSHPIAAGPHTLWLVLDGAQTPKRTFVIEEGKPKNLGEITFSDGS